MLGLLAAWSLLFTAFVVGVGGIMGFVKAKSKASLIAGLVSALFYILAFVVGRDHAQTGQIMGAVVSALLVVVFYIRLKKSGKFMPAGMMLVLCGLELLFLLGSLTIFSGPENYRPRGTSFAETLRKC
jgi:uncharacterized membrane protein (UPF0136 family)